MLRRSPGGEPHESKQTAQTPAGGAFQLTRTEDRGDGAYRVLYGGADGAGLGPRQHPQSGGAPAAGGRRPGAGKPGASGKN